MPQPGVSPAMVEAYRFARAGDIPNNPALPLLVYRAVLPDADDDDPATSCEAMFARNGWQNAWRDGVYDYHHFHTTAHEVLGIVRGEVTVRFGGESGRALTLRAGDVVVIPAGVGHKNEGSSRDLLVVGAYPAGQDWDICPPKPDERACAEADIRRVGLPRSDPVFGPAGPLIEQWKAGATASAG